jgi:hypothetical protein
MILISHRGNLDGPNKERENSPSYITEALDQGFDVEVDIWVKDDKIYLGHDNPQYEIELSFFYFKKLWCHAKNIEALLFMVKNNIPIYFWHQNDDVTLTSNNYIWTYPGKDITELSIVLPDGIENYQIDNCGGICSDYINKYK